MSGAITPAAILRAARGLVDRPEKWSQLDAYGYSEGGGIVSRCSVVAIDDAIEATGHAFDWDTVAAYFCTAIGGSCIASWQSTRTHAEVMEAFDRAIALAEAKQ